jgi:sugar lactone lactonase YvrE
MWHDEETRRRDRVPGPDGQDLRPFGDFSVDPSVTRFNDGKPDPWGDFWAGTMAVPEDSGYPCSLYRLSPDGAVTELFGGVGLSNGLDWSGDRRLFYYSDSHAGQPGQLGWVRRPGPEHPVHHYRPGELHPRRPGRRTARRRHLRLHPRRYRPPAILVRCLS